MQTRQAAASAALASWNALQPELLVLVAGECNAADMCSMMGSCVEWRDALQAQEPRIWERLLHQRFPRAADIMRMMPQPAGFDHKGYYRQQLQAEKTNKWWAPRTFSFDDFLFTLELCTTVDRRRTVVRSSSFHLDDDMTFRNNAAFNVEFDIQEWWAIWEAEDETGSTERGDELRSSMWLDIFVHDCCLHIVCDNVEHA